MLFYFNWFEDWFIHSKQFTHMINDEKRKTPKNIICLPTCFSRRDEKWCIQRSEVHLTKNIEVRFTSIFTMLMSDTQVIENIYQMKVVWFFIIYLRLRSQFGLEINSAKVQLTSAFEILLCFRKPRDSFNICPFQRTNYNPIPF